MTDSKTFLRNEGGVDLLTLLPNCLLQKILLEVPMDSILSLASTSWYWNNYLLSPDFARLHLRRWNNKYGIISRSINSELEYSTMCDVGSDMEREVDQEVDNDDAFPQVIWQRIQAAFAFIAELDPWFILCDSCDGQLLIQLDFHRIKCKLVVCNPLLRSYQTFTPPLGLVVRMSTKWNMVFVQSTQRYKLIGISADAVNSATGGGGLIFYILDIGESHADDVWKEVRVRQDELGIEWVGGEVKKRVLVEHSAGPTKMYYLVWSSRHLYQPVTTSLISIDVDTHEVKVVDLPPCWGMQSLGMSLWFGASAKGELYVTDFWNHTVDFDFFVVDDFANPKWTVGRVHGGDYRHLGRLIHPVACVEDGRILYEIYDDPYGEDGFVKRHRKPRSVKDLGVLYFQEYFYVRHVHSLIRI